MMYSPGSLMEMKSVSVAMSLWIMCRTSWSFGPMITNSLCRCSLPVKGSDSTTMPVALGGTWMA